MWSWANGSVQTTSPVIDLRAPLHDRECADHSNLSQVWTQGAGDDV